VAIDVSIRSARWQKQPQAAAIVRRAIVTAARAASTPLAELAIVLTHDSAMRVLNRTWRGKDAPTNVLSFPSERSRDNGPEHLGDIVIAFETVVREAKAEGKPFRHHLAHLAVHGYLHLLGHDHESDRDARKMERLERNILARLAIPDPYAAQPAGR
jgi:probable rRNA maturation factor